jgi:hypothetical protein
MTKPRNRVRQNGSASAAAQQATPKPIQAGQTRNSSNLQSAVRPQQGQGSAVAVAAALDLSADHQMLLEQFAKWWGLSVTEYCVRLLEAGFNCDGDVLHDMLRSRSSYPKAKRLVNFLKPIFQRVYGARGEYMAPCFEPTPEPSMKGLRV